MTDYLSVTPKVGEPEDEEDAVTIGRMLDQRNERIAELERDEAYWRGEYHKLAETPKGQIEDELQQLLVDIESPGGYKDRIAELEQIITEYQDIKE